MLQSHLVSITEVRMSPDLRHATVFVKPLLGQDEDAVLKALRQNTAFLQREVARRVRTKYAAKLKFLADESFDESSHIDQLLRTPKIAQDLDGNADRGGILLLAATPAFAQDPAATEDSAGQISGPPSVRQLPRS